MRGWAGRPLRLASCLHGENMSVRHRIHDNDNDVVREGGHAVGFRDSVLARSTEQLHGDAEGATRESLRAMGNT
jgi:hypothetical protein